MKPLRPPSLLLEGYALAEDWLLPNAAARGSSTFALLLSLK